MDFPDTRRCLALLPAWLRAISATSRDPVPVQWATGLRYRFPAESPEVVQTAKAVRMVSGLNAAMHLADEGFTVETASILRLVTDFANEIVVVGEGLDSGHLTAAQKKFVDDFFQPLPGTFEEFIEQQAQSYIGRKELYKSHRRLAEKALEDPDGFVELGRFLDRGYDSYVHGGYETAMELYDPNGRAFNVGGTRSVRNRCICKVAVAGKLYFCMLALELIARQRGLNIAEEIRVARDSLESSPEYGGSVCDGL
jgi:hypothetical protein